LFPAWVPVPEIRIDVKTKYGFAKQWFLVDTGADITMLPSHSSEWLDCHLQKKKARVYGIDGTGVTVSASNIIIKIRDKEEKIRCVFSNRDDIPFILGRLDILKSYDLHFLKDRLCLDRRRK
jgi:predicted aspartyl protease